MNYEESINYIHQTPKFSRELGNAMLAKLLVYLDNPEKKLKFIHIAGTNGKGSIAVMLSEILQQSSYCTGLFTSPYIEQFNERIRVNGQMIPNDALAEITTKIKVIIETQNTPVSEFALDTAIALYYFMKKKCDVVVLETGLGGRLDATNIIPDNLVSVISAVDLDHTQYLGDTIEKITAEKCGIIKHNRPVVSYPLQHASALDVIKNTAVLNNCSLYVADTPVPHEDYFELYGKRYKLALKGDFQAYNAATVLKVIEVLQMRNFIFSDSDVKIGLENAVNPARFEKFGDRIILDGGHNPHAIKALCKSLSEYKKSIYFCVAMMEDKDYRENVKILSENSNGIIVTQISMQRCCKAEILATEFKKYNKKVFIEENPESAIKKALEIADSNALICICGSLYLAGEVRPILNKCFGSSQNQFT